MGLFPVSHRSMHFNSNPPQVDLSESRGPEREGKGKAKGEKGEGDCRRGAAGIGEKWGMKRAIVSNRAAPLAAIGPAILLC